MSKMRRYCLVFVGIVFMVTGCASKPPEPKPRIPTEEIRKRADRAFEDVKSEETKDTSHPRPRTQSDTEQRETVRVTKGKRPDWVDGDSIQYPSSEYLIGVGYGPDRASAEDKARAEIAKIFLSKIDSRTKSYQDYLQTTSKGKSKIEETLSIEEVTKVSSQKVLSGVRIAHVYHEAGSLFYALAVLNREQSAKILRDKIEELDQGIRETLANATQAEDMLTKVKYLKYSIQEHILREAYDAELRIVSRSGSGVSPPVSFTELKNQLESVLLRDFLIGVSISGSRASEIQDALVQGLNQQGFAISEDSSRTNVLVKGTVEITPLERGTSEWKYVRWRTHFDMIDKRGETVFGSVNKSGREGHLNLSQAENRAVRKIQKALATEIVEEMKRYIFSQ